MFRGALMSKPFTGEIERILQTIEPSHRRTKLRRSLDLHFQDPDRHDGRGRKASELATVKTTLRHIRNLDKWIERENYDLNVRRKIKKILKRLDHHQSWEQTVIEARKARGLANCAGKTWNDRKEYGPGDVLVLDQEYSVIPLNSVERMRSTGKRGHNCLVDSSHYFDKLRNWKTKFFEVQKSGIFCACFSVDCESSKVAEIYGSNNDEADLPPNILWQICQVLGIRGDSEELFLTNGVFSMFLDRTADQTAPMFKVAGYQLWWRKGEVVVKDARKEHWSRFEWTLDEWCETWGSKLTIDNFDVMRRLHPMINELVRQATPTRPQSKDGHDRNCFV